MQELILIAYLISAILFILAIKQLGKIDTARNGNILSSLGMLIAISATFLKLGFFDTKLIFIAIFIGTIIGTISALRVAMTAMPEMVGIFNGFGGGASALVASAEMIKIANGTAIDNSTVTLITIMLSVIIGSITLSGSFIAFGKLKGFISGQPITYLGQNIFNIIILFSIILTSYFSIINPFNLNVFYLLIGIGILLGILSVIPIGGADMPVVISLLNSYSGIAAACTGFVLKNHALIVSGALVGASGIF